MRRDVYPPAFPEEAARLAEEARRAEAVEAAAERDRLSRERPGAAGPVTHGYCANPRCRACPHNVKEVVSA